MDTKTRDFSGNFSRGSTRALVETMCSVLLWNSYPKMRTNEQKGAHLGTKPFAMLKLLKWNSKVRRIMPTAWGCTRPTSTAMSGCPGTAMPCLQSHVHLVGRNPQVLSWPTVFRLEFAMNARTINLRINICLTYIQRHRWSGFKTDCFISSGSWGLKPGINTVFSVKTPTTLPQDVFRRIPLRQHACTGSNGLRFFGHKVHGIQVHLSFRCDHEIHGFGLRLQMFPAIGNKHRVRWMKLPWFKTPEKKKKLKLPSFSSSSASVCPNFSVAFHHLPHYSALDIVGYIVISYCTLLMLTLHDIISIWFRHSIPIHHSLVHHFCWFTSPFIKAPIKPICRATRMSSAAPSSAAFKASACPIPWLAPVISANVLMLLDGLKTDC